MSANNYKLEEAIEKPCSDVLAHTPNVCKGILPDQRVPASKDNCDSQGMCTTFVKCRTVMIAVLIVMNGMDPHMIRETWVGMVGLLGLC
jgi:hypothetical protein